MIKASNEKEALEKAVDLFGWSDPQEKESLMASFVVVKSPIDW
jgi:hypothetical protein